MYKSKVDAVILIKKIGIGIRKYCFYKIMISVYNLTFS